MKRLFSVLSFALVALISCDDADHEEGTTGRLSYIAIPGDPVDLGLSVKWSSTNLGAQQVTDFGDYFAWGEIEPKNDYSWSTYIWCSGTQSTLTKYNYDLGFGPVDNKTDLKDYAYKDDVARVVLGGKWRIPTAQEWTELRNNCSWTWKSKSSGYAHEGYLVTAMNGNSIFLPAAGYKDGTRHNFPDHLAYYWSSAISAAVPYKVWAMYFRDGERFGEDNSRYHGFSIRPVTE